MNNEVFKNIHKIIERDSKSTTYKFALLRGVIDIINDNSPYITFSNDRVSFHTGLLIEKWLLYYYPIFDSTKKIHQINGSAKLGFENEFITVIQHYKDLGGFSVFYNDLRNKGFPDNIKNDFIALAKKMREKITSMPMKHIGYSINAEHYSIFKYHTTKTRYTIPDRIDLEFIINSFGKFSIPLEYYKAFQVIGSFVSGQDSLLFKWAEFSVNASNKTLTLSTVLNDVLKNPITTREIKESINLYKSILRKRGKVYCVWSGKSIIKYDVDHMIPFSVWKNNDLWNLLPSHSTTNNKKRDKIPSPALIEKQKDLILDYWQLINKNSPIRFQKELQLALLGDNTFDTYQNTAITQLQSRCDYLISVRGFEEWNNTN